MKTDHLVIRGAREHNLRNVDVRIPRGRLTVVTGLSGSGKSSLAFDTIYAEGQRRYVESLSAYARQFLGLMEKPDVDAIEGLSPAISIEQKTVSKNPRSTVGTVTEVYDYLRLLWARVGIPHCPDCGEPVRRQSASQIVDRILEWDDGTRLQVLAPLVRGRKGEFREVFERARKEGFVRVHVNGETYDLTDPPKLNRYENHDVAVVVDRLKVDAEDRQRLADSVETALRTGEGTLEVLKYGKGRDAAPTSHLFSEQYACAGCGTSMTELEPRQFSFNSPYGACPECDGLGTRKEVNAQLLLADGSLSILEGVILPWGAPGGHLARSVIPGLAEAYEFDPNTPWADLDDVTRDAILDGSGSMKIRFPYKSGGKKTDGYYEDQWEGVVASVERAQARLPVGISQEPAVEDEIRARGQATAVGEGHHRDGQPRFALAREEARDLGLQVMGAERAGVHEDRGAPAQPGQKLELARDPVGGIVGGRQRMPAPRLGIAPLQGVRIAVEKQQIRLEIRSLDERLVFEDQTVGREIAGPGVGPEGQRAVWRRARQKSRHEAQRQIVDRLEAQILQRVDRRAAPRPRGAGDEHDPRPDAPRLEVTLARLGHRLPSWPL